MVRNRCRRRGTDFADKDISIMPGPLGTHGETGMIVVGSSRADFPGQTESLLLSVAANQASIGLKEAWLLSEQKRIANQLERQVAERTEGLAAANEKLKKSEAALHKALDEIKNIRSETTTGDRCDPHAGVVQFARRSQ